MCWSSWRRQARPEEILWQAKPHVGTDRLRETVKGLRNRILELGGEVRFSHQVTGILADRGRLRGLRVRTPSGEEEIRCDQAVLAIGHSARDTVDMLYRSGLPIEPKPFAVGVRTSIPGSGSTGAATAVLPDIRRWGRRITSCPAALRDKGACIPSVCAPAEP